MSGAQFLRHCSVCSRIGHNAATCDQVLIAPVTWRNPIPHPFTAAGLKVTLLRTAPMVLTLRERAVFWSVAHGLCNREIAILMGLSERTVETYRDRIHDKISGCSGAVHIGVLAHQILTLGREP